MSLWDTKKGVSSPNKAYMSLNTMSQMKARWIPRFTAPRWGVSNLVIIHLVHINQYIVSLIFAANWQHCSEPEYLSLIFSRTPFGCWKGDTTVPQESRQHWEEWYGFEWKPTVQEDTLPIQGMQTEGAGHIPTPAQCSSLGRIHPSKGLVVLSPLSMWVSSGPEFH